MGKGHQGFAATIASDPGIPLMTRNAYDHGVIGDIGRRPVAEASFR